MEQFIMGEKTVLKSAKQPQPGMSLHKAVELITSNNKLLRYIEHPIVKLYALKVDGFAYRCGNGLAVIQSEAVEKDNQRWLHTSFSRKSRMPEYKDMKWVKEVFIGPDRPAIMVLPTAEDHVNIHQFTLHFFTPQFNSPLPDFTQGTGSI